MIQPPDRVVSPANPEPEDQEQASVREEAATTLAALMPWGVSLAIHAALVTLALVVIWAVIDDQETDAGLDAAVVTVNPAPASALHKMLQVEQVEKTRPDASTSPTPAPTPDTIGTASADATAAEVFNVADLGMPELGDFTPMDDRDIFDPKGPRAGDPDRAHRVVYVIDASGSLIDTFPFVIRELKRSIANLPSDYQYTVIFFQDGRAIEPRPLGLKEASPYTRLEMIRWFRDIRPSGRTSPVPALERALSYRPDEVFLLSDNITGGGTGATEMELEQQRLLNVVKQTNRDTRIHTIQYLYRDPLAQAQAQGMKGTLEMISDMTGGEHRYVPESEMLGIDGGAEANPWAGKVQIDL